MKEEFKINMFIEPILNKKKKHHLSSYIQLRRLIRKLNKTSPSFDMMLEMHEFIKLLERLYMYGNDNNKIIFNIKYIINFLTKKNYHVSKRTEDGKWQVKFATGQKVIKLFDTQAEAIKYAQNLADNQDGCITIHKVDGKIRKQDYSKK